MEAICWRPSFWACSRLPGVARHSLRLVDGAVPSTGELVLLLSNFCQCLATFARIYSHATSASQQLHTCDLLLQVSFAEAATVATVFTTVDTALCDGAAIKEGSRVLVHGAAGGVGLAACQLAASMGAEVVGTAGPAKRALLRTQGTSRVFNSRNTSFSELVIQTSDQTNVRIRCLMLTDECSHAFSPLTECLVCRFSVSMQFSTVLHPLGLWPEVLRPWLPVVHL